MGEIHYARVPAAEWKREIQKMRAGGITIIATYCFWIHHEPAEGQWDWSGNKNLRQFLQVCKEEDMPVVLRIGPFCHGEVYQGGIPAWIVEKALSDPQNYKLRSTAPGFLAATRRLYEHLFAQAKGLLWKDGGPVVGIQIENECSGPWSYLMALRETAVSIGFDVPFMTRTGWPKLNGPEEFGKLLPLYGDYADGFWDRSLNDMPGDYPKAFTMKEQRINANIATETFSKKELTEGGGNSKVNGRRALTYPYLTCELGGGMMPSYHRRINISGNEAAPLAICKLGSGSNLLGYYMYHGGTNPYCTDHTMAETQDSKVTNYNDMPYMTYDFQAPLGEMGQPNLNAFHQTRLLHQFLADWGDMLSQMDVDSISEHYARRGCFEFYNDYVRLINEGGRAYVRPVDMPWGGHSITANAQPFCKTDNTLYFIPIKGMEPKIWIDGNEVIGSKGKGPRVNSSFHLPHSSLTKDMAVTLLSEDEAIRSFKIDNKIYVAKKAGNIIYKDGDKIVEEEWKTQKKLSSRKIKRVKEAGEPRIVPMGAQKAAAMPTDEDFENAAVWHLNIKGLPAGADNFLRIDYTGDCARIYADGKLVMDNFWNGKPMLVRMSDLEKKTVELRILPLSKDAPIYLQKEQKEIRDSSPSPPLQLDGISLLLCHHNNKTNKSVRVNNVPHGTLSHMIK